MNGFISRLVHGTKHLGVEIAKNITIARGRRILKTEVLKNNIRNNFEKEVLLLGRKVQKKIVLKFLDEKIKNSLESASLNLDELSFFYRAKFLNQTFASEIHKEIKTNSFTIELSTSDGKYRDLLGSIICFFKSNGVIYSLIRSMLVRHSDMFYVANVGAIVKHILPVQENTSDVYYRIVRADSIVKIEKLIKVSDNYICRRPNCILSSVV